MAAPAMAVMLLGSLSGSTSTMSAATIWIPLNPLSTFRTKSEPGPPITGVPAVSYTHLNQFIDIYTVWYHTPGDLINRAGSQRHKNNQNIYQRDIPR